MRRFVGFAGRGIVVIGAGMEGARPSRLGLPLCMEGYFGIHAYLGVDGKLEVASLPSAKLAVENWCSIALAF